MGRGHVDPAGIQRSLSIGAKSIDVSAPQCYNISYNAELGYYYAENNYPGEKIVVVKTREWAYRYIEKKSSRLIKMYRKNPLFMESLRTVNSRANALTNELLKKQAEGKVFVIAPSRPVTVSKFEGNMEKLGDLYFLGFNDALNVLDELKGYLRA